MTKRIELLLLLNPLSLSRAAGITDCTRSLGGDTARSRAGFQNLMKVGPV